MCLAQRPCYRLDSGSDRSLLWGCWAHTRAVEDHCCFDSSTAACASQMHLAQRRAENQSSSYCVIRCALDSLPALFCSTRSELVASWPQMLNYGLVTNGYAPPCSWATDFYVFSVNFILSVELYTYPQNKTFACRKNNDSSVFEFTCMPGAMLNNWHLVSQLVFTPS